ncbi:hypothetical protein SAMD00019534_034670, partial [Acytostelium subglobosum LB1]|uniref:hypothetical protein n=1 Tax=Acytostelium subglobosum LB1 TaxID=1410327 RepID=UPI000644AAB9
MTILACLRSLGGVQTFNSSSQTILGQTTVGVTQTSNQVAYDRNDYINYWNNVRNNATNGNSGCGCS